MNKQQKEVQQAFLNSEKKTLKELEELYKDALADINAKLEALMGRQDADMQNVIYQVEYQKSLKTQVQAVLEQLQANEFETLSDYLTSAYTDGFVGTMYDMHGQDVPLIVPIDQKQVVDAIQHDTKLKKKLYDELGLDINQLKKQIASEISRGISTGLSYGEIARNISDYAKIPKNRAMTIARTEAHRIQIQATADAQKKAKAKGADVVKQWDATLDGDTRKSHRKLDGQIRELNEPFEVNGKKVMHPGGFGRPEEDINCRCALLQRARWALDDKELQTLKERADFFELDKKDEFEEFKKKYLKALEDIDEDAARAFKNLTFEEFQAMKHNITKEERNIVYGKGHFSGYINSSNARKINEKLRNGEILPSEYQEIADTLQKVIDKNFLNDDIMVKRYVKGDALESLIGVKFPEYKLTMKVEEYWDAIESIPMQMEKGIEYIEKGFLSTSGVDDKNVMTDKLVKLNIKAPKGTNCYITTNNKESEIIFGQDTKLKITNCTIENSRQAGWKIVLDCIIV